MSVFILCGISCLSTRAQENSPLESSQAESATEIVTTDGVRTIILTPERQPEPDFLYAARAQASVRVSPKTIEYSIEVQVRIIQGKGKTIRFGLNGSGEVQEVTAEGLASWSVRNMDEGRFLDLEFHDFILAANASLKIVSELESLPADIELAHLSPGEAISFESLLQVDYETGLSGEIMTSDGFVPLQSEDQADRLQSSTGGQLVIRLDRQSLVPPPVELLEAKLTGTLHPNGRSVSFNLVGKAAVAQPGTRLGILSGGIAMSRLPDGDDYRLELSMSNRGALYELEFPRAGTFPIHLDFVADVTNPENGWSQIDFTVDASAVVPILLHGLGPELEFRRDGQTVVPVPDGTQWRGFLPVTGRVNMQWKSALNARQGKLFFTATARIEATVGPGLLRQGHVFDFQVLQGQLKSLNFQLLGPGEILDVEGAHIVAWEVQEQETERHLEITLSQPITGNSQIQIRSQTPLGPFPVRIDGLNLRPAGAIRNSGHLRISNSGSVRVEPTALRGLTQLSPDQFPGETIAARQQFVYRFPAPDYAFTMVADRIQPEVSVTELVLYQLSESDRMITADVELDIREAAIREWNFVVPQDYSIVSITGASVADYVASSEATDEQRNVKVLFNQDVQGRQLLSMRLEKSEVATPGDWILPRLEYPDAKTVRGDIGVVAAPGFRMTVATSEMLVEKPLSYFPKPIPNLQQAFRMRDPGWSATLQIELLERSIQSDVFHLYSLSQGTVYGSALVNYLVAGAPTAEWQLSVPAALSNVTVDGRDIRTWRREGDVLFVSLHQPVMGPYTLLVTFEEKPNGMDGSFQAGQIAPLGVQGDRGYVEIVSPMQVEIEPLLVSSPLLALDPLELPGEFRLLSTAPALGIWQYTQRPFDLKLKVNWFEPGTTATQIVEFSEANSRVSADGELVTDVLYYVKSRGQRTLRLQFPGDPVRLWAVSVNGRPVTARQAGKETLVPLPGGADPNVPIEVSVRMGKPAVSGKHTSLVLPTVLVPVLETQWNVEGDENHVVVPSGGTVEPTIPVRWPNGFDWIAQRGMISLAVVATFAILGRIVSNAGGLARLLGLIGLTMAVSFSAGLAWNAWEQASPLSPLQLSLPVLSAGEIVELEVENVPSWQVVISWLGIGLAAAGVPLFCLTWCFPRTASEKVVRMLGFGLIGVGVLLQVNGAPWFFVMLTISLMGFQLLPAAVKLLRDLRAEWRARRDGRQLEQAILEQEDLNAKHDQSGGGEPPAVVTSILIFLAAACTAAAPQVVAAANLETFQAGESLTQQWQVSSRDSRLSARATMILSGNPGDRFVLLQAPAVLTHFDGPGLRLSKLEIPGRGLNYVITIPLPGYSSDAPWNSAGAEAAISPDSSQDPGDQQDHRELREYRAVFEFQLEAVRPAEGIPILTGNAALQQIDLSYDESGWDVVCANAARIEPLGQRSDDEQSLGTHVQILLKPGPSQIVLKPQVRDLTTEEVLYFVEGAHLYMPVPGAVDGRHRFDVRTSQGQVRHLHVGVPEGLTVSAVDGPVEAWQFDADHRRLQLEIESATSANFVIHIETQRSLEPFPTAVRLEPLRVEGAGGEVGLIAVAFGSDAQPEKVETEALTLVNLGDFDANLLNDSQSVLYRVYRYGDRQGSMRVQVAPVASEVRVVSQQVLSLGDERVVLGINFTAEITRSGLFQLSFPLPDGLDVESLSGNSLHHWSELTEDGQRQIVLHLNGRTIGPQRFSLALAGAAPTDAVDWEIPRFELNEATRQSGELVVQPVTGIRLRTVARQNVSESDPRSMGGQGQGALAFRLLQRDWSLTLGIEKLAPWVTGQVLHEVTLREGQTRSNLIADFQVENASIRTLIVTLPLTNADEIKTVRASGETVSDFVRTVSNENIWELRLKRRVIGHVQFKIEYERRGDRADDSESLSPIGFPELQQLAYYYAVRAGGRLEIEPVTWIQGWQRAEWNMVPQSLREAGNRNAPSLALRAMTPTTPLSLVIVRHALADALKLRVASGVLTTVLSPTGDQLTAIDLTMEVIQRSNLSVQLPAGGELFSIFVNGESVHSIRQNAGFNAWQFYILPGMDERTAQVRFVYSVTGDNLAKMKLVSPQLNVPLENVQWNISAPEGFELWDSDGNLELIGQDRRESYDRASYLSKVSGKRQLQAQQAVELLEQANELLQAGEQAKARWALNSVANQYALDAASNEDARVQLENLQTQQAIVGLNTRRQRLFLDNNRDVNSVVDNEQLRQAAAANPILQDDQLNFRPQELSQLLAGNSSDDNAILQQIAGRLVQHQRTTEPAPQAIIISMPEEGTVYRFSRSVQVAENAPLTLSLQFHSRYKLQPWQWALIGGMLVGIAASLAISSRKAEMATT